MNRYQWLLGQPAWTKYDEKIKRACDACDVPAEWVKAILIVESELGENPLVKNAKISSDKKSWGIAQFKPSTASWMAKRTVTPQELLNVYFSIELCARYVSYLSDRFGRDELKVVMAYNEGQGAVSKGKMDLDYYKKWCAAMDLIHTHSFTLL